MTTFIFSLFLMFAPAYEEKRAAIDTECRVQSGVCIGVERERVQPPPTPAARLRQRSSL